MKVGLKVDLPNQADLFRATNLEEYLGAVDTALSVFKDSTSGHTSVHSITHEGCFISFSVGPEGEDDTLDKVQVVSSFIKSSTGLHKRFDCEVRSLEFVEDPVTDDIVMQLEYGPMV